MAPVFARLGRVVAHHPRLTVVLWLVLTVAGYALAVLGVHGQGLFDRVGTGDPGVSGSESSQGQTILNDARTSGPAVTLVLDGVDPAAPDLSAALDPARADLAAVDGVATVIDPLVLPGGPENPAAAPLLAEDGEGLLVVVELEPDLTESAETAALDAVEERLREVPGELVAVAPDATGVVGAEHLIVDEITHQVEEDLRTGEVVALPIALAVMVLVFGGFLAAAMPMAGALASIGGGLGTVLALTYVMDVDAAVVNVVTVLGLGLSIDYGLLVVSRFREELHRLVDADGGAGSRRRRGDGAVVRAVETTMATAGRTVAFSAVTVAIAISGLLAFRPEILRAIAAAGVLVLVVAAATALTLVPALLTLSGRRLARPGVLARVPGVRRLLARASDVDRAEGAFSSLAARVQRHPWWVMLGSVALLTLLALPVLRMELRISGIELLPAGTAQREYVAALEEDYAAAASPPVTVVAATTLDEAAAWSQEVAALDGVASVDPPAPAGSYVVVGIRPDADDPGGDVAVDVVREVRGLDAPFDRWVVGQAASQIDFTDALVERAPLALTVVALATLLLLFLMTGSVVIPLKALLTNTLSILASLGVLVWAFQDGHLEGLLGFQSTGGIETYVLALVAAFAFGLAMDYEVFLLARVKELHDSGLPTDEAVRLGLQRSGRIITSAAAIIIVVFAGFVAGDLIVIKQVGFALAVAVLIDATIVRMLLVPATMTVLNRANWWAPKPLRRVYERFAILH
ncbi:MMPL family transporter [Cellulomonas shaoxiangyii]|uniref:MMPL family transporter n=1 Tax=Cellulomonas shaoxiangyii TaxID=2566013 RepID=A0A4P7SJJ4_9CELL|nr:MMPL family transporter [Cellulomonas shaoxiangyii]QCB93657.1 MMPL family transporter [Cellulomonas shaoxiangyii]TGY86138.1 MMPL family transporter [Cellulomonas shaoxiangyii]